MLSCTDFFSSVSTYTFLYTLTICSPNSRLKSRVCGSLLITLQVYLAFEDFTVAEEHSLQAIL